VTFTIFNSCPEKSTEVTTKRKPLTDTGVHDYMADIRAVFNEAIDFVVWICFARFSLPASNNLATYFLAKAIKSIQLYVTESLQKNMPTFSIYIDKSYERRDKKYAVSIRVTQNRKGTKKLCFFTRKKEV